MTTFPDTFTVNNDVFHKRASADICFELVEQFENAAVYRRTKDTVMQYSYNTLRANDKWAVKYCAPNDKRRNKYFTSKKKALAFAENVNAKIQLTYKKQYL